MKKYLPNQKELFILATLAAFNIPFAIFIFVLREIMTLAYNLTYKEYYGR